MMIFKAPRSWQATCCRVKSHIKPDKPRTRCTRTISYKGPDDGIDDMRVRNACHLWLNMCTQHVSKTSHNGVRNSLLFDSLPSEADLLQNRLPDDYSSDGEFKASMFKAKAAAAKVCKAKASSANSSASSSSSSSISSSSS